MTVMPDTLDEVLDELRGIIAQSRAGSSRLGYFPAVYERVTAAVKERVETGYFDDGPRIARLTVRFANYYLEAYQRHQRHEAAAESWRVAFEAADRWRPIVLQHIILGINAHINLDLGLATAETAEESGLPLRELRADFDRINGILASLIDGIQRDLARIWPALRLLDAIGQRADEALSRFSVTRAREHAWSVAEELTAMDSAERRAARIREVDAGVARLGRKVLHPGLLLSAVHLVVRIGEPRSVPLIIDRLSSAAARARA